MIKKKEMKVFINEDLRPVRAAVMKMAVEPNVKDVSSGDGKILVQFTGKDRPVYLNTPDDLHKIGITNPDWKKPGTRPALHRKGEHGIPWDAERDSIPRNG